MNDEKYTHVGESAFPDKLSPDEIRKIIDQDGVYFPEYRIREGKVLKPNIPEGLTEFDLGVIEKEGVPVKKAAIYDPSKTELQIENLNVASDENDEEFPDLDDETKGRIFDRSFGIEVGWERKNIKELGIAVFFKPI